MQPRVSGVYRVTNKINGKVYIGSSQNVRARWNLHRSELRRGVHGNSYWQREWNRYGGDAFVFEMIELVGEPAQLLVVEQRWIDRLCATDRTKGYNLSLIAGAPMRGRKVSEEARRRQSERLKGVKLGPPSQEARERMRAAKLGKPASGMAAKGAANFRAKVYVVTELASGMTQLVKGISEFCREHGLNQGAMCEMARPGTRRYQHRGYTCAFYGGHENSLA